MHHLAKPNTRNFVEFRLSATWGGSKLEAMDANYEKILHSKIKRTIDALKKNRMNAAYLPTKEDALKAVKALLEKDSTCAVGGSVTLRECGVLDLVTNGDYRFVDRTTIDNDRDIVAATFTSDTFLASCNAVTEHGELYFVDGRGTRIAPIIYGPKQVILIVSVDKIVSDIAQAVERTKRIAAPANALRLEKRTYCTDHGHCMNPNCDERNFAALPSGACNDTICCDYLVLSQQRVQDRIKVLLVGQQLGY